MKTITNLEQVSGGKVTLSYCLNGDIMVECSSHKDEFSFGDFEHLPRGTFTNTGYFGTDGGFFLAEKLLCIWCVATSCSTKIPYLSF